MAKPVFTDNQQLAIDLRDRNILVSAAAGSGKTAVLVERIIRRILDENRPVDIDRILVMTFTRAAAAQMKEKILNAINEKRSINPHDRNLNKQYALVHNANIMTIDSFCMNVVRNHFGEIGLSPDFRMADEGEMRLLKQDVLEEVIEARYEGGGDDFLRMTEVFASKKTDTAIEDLVLSLYTYSQSYPDPQLWLDMCTRDYSDFSRESEPEWLKAYEKLIRTELERVRTRLDEAGDMCRQEFGPLPYLNAIENELELTDSLLGFRDYPELYEKCIEQKDYTYEKLKPVRIPKEGEATLEEIEERTAKKEMVKSIRDICKEQVQSVLTSVCAINFEELKNGMSMMKSHIGELVSLTGDFASQFGAKKREKNIVDFNDIEHMCLEILRNGEDTTALEYRDFFEEIYVDEYQDSNLVQEEILGLISKRDENKGNVFMVGDVKQSIYGFRMAKPEIFVGKYDRFGEYVSNNENNDGSKPERDIRICLSDNFRSRKEVLSSVNNVFSKIMSRDFCGIEYDDAAALHPGKTYTDSESDYTTELNLMIKDKEADERESEALLVANRIKEMVGTFLIEDEGEMRPLKYSDIVILLRTAKGWDNTFMSILEGQGIPVFVTSQAGYFESMEIITILNFLRIIDNPLQDIPLAAVMMSVIGNFSEEEVALIRAAFKNGCLYEALVNYSNISDGNVPELLRKKTEDFLNNLNGYRIKAGYMSVAEILTEIIDGEYGKIIRAMPGGAKKYANLNMLLRKASEYGKTSYKGIFHFNRYIEALRKYDIDYGEANISDENADTVRIMSIHKSKGLEFPVCFVCGMGKKINKTDVRTAVLTDPEYGIAADFIDIDRRLKSKSPFKAVVSKKKEAEIIAEEMRVLYVAMTRAKEKLIMTGTVRDEEAICSTMLTIDHANSYLDMCTLASDNGNIPEINICFKTVEDLIDDAVAEGISAEVNRKCLVDIVLGEEGACAELKPSDEYERLKKILTDRFNYKYPYEDRGNVKVSVSELKHRSETAEDMDSREDAAPVKYEYEPGQNNKAALHGTAVHRIFELWDYSLEPDRESVDRFLKYVDDEKLMEDDLLELVRADEIYAFVSSDIAARMADAYKRGELYREQPFVISDNPEDPDSPLVQGIIDAYFIEDGKIVLVDYKTDRGKNESQLAGDHSTQLAYYSKALSRLLHLDVKESIIYSTFLKKSIVI